MTRAQFLAAALLTAGSVASLTVIVTFLAGVGR